MIRSGSVRDLLLCMALLVAAAGVAVVVYVRVSSGRRAVQASARKPSATIMQVTTPATVATQQSLIQYPSVIPAAIPSVTASGQARSTPQRPAPNFLAGANVPWYHWGCDFGCGATGGGISAPSVQQALAPVFSQARASGMKVLRWWLFEGTPWQITTNESGSPTGINPQVYPDIDAALHLAASDGLAVDFVLFSGPTAIPTSWETDPSERAALASVLGQLFAHYQGNSQIYSWEVFNEPEWDIWNHKIDAASVQATVKAVAASVHANTSAKVTVGSADLDGLPLWEGLGLDFYEAHWYDSMPSGTACAICTTYAALAARDQLDAPLVIGEFYAGSDAQAGNPEDRWQYWYTNGYAGAWAWSLFPDHTNDKMSIDFTAVRAFTARHPQFAAAAP